MNLSDYETAFLIKRKQASCQSESLHPTSHFTDNMTKCFCVNKKEKQNDGKVCSDKIKKKY